MKTIEVVAAIIESEGKILAAQRAADDALAPLKWEFPGGKVEPGETLEAALRREITEELNIKLAAIWHLEDKEVKREDSHLILHFFVAALPEGEKPQTLVHEKLRWLAQAELLDVDWLENDRELIFALGTAWEEIFSTARL